MLKNNCLDGLWIGTAVISLEHAFIEPIHASVKVQLLPLGLAAVRSYKLLKGPALRCFCTAYWGTVGTGGRSRSDSWMKRPCGVCYGRYTLHANFDDRVLSSLVTLTNSTFAEMDINIMNYCHIGVDLFLSDSYIS